MAINPLGGPGQWPGYGGIGPDLSSASGQANGQNLGTDAIVGGLVVGALAIPTATLLALRNRFKNKGTDAGAARAGQVIPPRSISSAIQTSGTKVQSATIQYTPKKIAANNGPSSGASGGSSFAAIPPKKTSVNVFPFSGKQQGSYGPQLGMNGNHGLQPGANGNHGLQPGTNDDQGLQPETSGKKRPSAAENKSADAANNELGRGDSAKNHGDHPTAGTVHEADKSGMLANALSGAYKVAAKVGETTYGTLAGLAQAAAETVLMPATKAEPVTPSGQANESASPQSLEIPSPQPPLPPAETPQQAVENPQQPAATPQKPTKLRAEDTQVDRRWWPWFREKSVDSASLNGQEKPKAQVRSSVAERMKNIFVRNKATVDPKAAEQKFVAEQKVAQQRAAAAVVDLPIGGGSSQNAETNFVTAKEKAASLEYNSVLSTATGEEKRYAPLSEGETNNKNAGRLAKNARNNAKSGKNAEQGKRSGRLLSRFGLTSTRKENQPTPEAPSSVTSPETLTENDDFHSIVSSEDSFRSVAHSVHDEFPDGEPAVPSKNEPTPEEKLAAQRFADTARLGKPEIKVKAESPDDTGSRIAQRLELARQSIQALEVDRASSADSDISAGRAAFVPAEYSVPDAVPFEEGKHGELYCEKQVETDCGRHASNAALDGLAIKHLPGLTLRPGDEQASSQQKAYAEFVRGVRENDKEGARNDHYIYAKQVAQWHNAQVAELIAHFEANDPAALKAHRHVLLPVESVPLDFIESNSEEFQENVHQALADSPQEIHRMIIGGPESYNDASKGHFVSLAWKKPTQENSSGSWFRLDSSPSPNITHLVDASNDHDGAAQAITRHVFKNSNTQFKPMRVAEVLVPRVK